MRRECSNEDCIVRGSVCYGPLFKVELRREVGLVTRRLFGVGFLSIVVLAGAISFGGVVSVHEAGAQSSASGVPSTTLQPQPSFGPARPVVRTAAATARVAGAVARVASGGANLYAWGDAAGGKLGDGTVSGLRTTAVGVSPPATPLLSVLAGHATLRWLWMFRGVCGRLAGITVRLPLLPTLLIRG